VKYQDQENFFYLAILDQIVHSNLLLVEWNTPHSFLKGHLSNSRNLRNLTQILSIVLDSIKLAADMFQLVLIKKYSSMKAILGMCLNSMEKIATLVELCHATLKTKIYLLLVVPIKLSKFGILDNRNLIKLLTSKQKVLL